MKRALHWLVLVALIAGGLALANDSVVAQSGTTATIMCSQYLRTEPSEDSSRVGLMNPGESHAVLGRYGGWVYLQVGGDLQGWAYYGNCLAVNGDFNALPLLDPAALQLAVLTAPPTATVACSQYLRRAPASDAEVIQVLSEADSPLSISSRTSDNSWIQVTTVGGQVGWAAYTECLRIQGSFYAVPATVETTAVSTGAPVGSMTCTQNMRAYPSNDGRRLAVLSASDNPVSILGRTADLGWAYVSTATGWEGWMATGFCLNIQGSLLEAPIIGEESYSGPPIAQIACTQNLRSDPANEATAVGVLGPGDSPLPISGRTANGGWVYVSLPNGIAGWTANAACVSVLGNIFSVPEAVSGGVTNVTVNVAPTARILCSQYMRAMPSAEGSRLAIMQPGDGVYDVTGRSSDGSWLYLSLPGSFQGWAAWGSCLDVTGNVYSLPALDEASYSGPPQATVACTQYLRSAPDMNARTLDPMPAGTSLTVEGRSEDGSWVYVTKEDGSQGWTALGSCLNVLGNVYSRPVMTAATYSGAPIATVSCAQYLREYPDGASERLLKIDGTEGTLSITGRSADSSWMQITLNDGMVGWAATGVCLGVMGDFYSVPVVQAGPSPYTGAPLAVVNCSQYLRSEPNRDAEPLLVINGVEGDLSITRRSADGAWMEITLEDGTVGWAATNACLSVLGTFTDAPVIDTSVPEYSGPVVASLTCDQNLRAAPVADAERIDVLRTTDGQLDLLARNGDLTWLYVRRASDGQAGWTSYTSCLSVQGDVAGLPLREVSAYDGPPIADIVCDANLRRTPTAGGDILAVLTADSGLFNVLARSTDGYILVEGGSGLAGWVSLGSCVETQGDVVAAPIPAGSTNQSLWTVLRAEGSCSGADQASQVIATYNRSAPLGPVSLQCSSDSAALLALAQFRAEIAVVSGGCPGFQSVALSGGQSICFRSVHTTQVDDFANYARGR